MLVFFSARHLLSSVALSAKPKRTEEEEAN
jgi:hypothetical protein